MDGEHTVRQLGGDDNRGQHHGITPSGGNGTARLTSFTNPLDDMDCRTHHMCRGIYFRR